jgi:hypothetical protein
MTTNILIEKLKNIFIEEAYGKPTNDNDELGINYGIRIIEIEDPSQLKGWYYRKSKEDWLSPQNVTYKIGLLEFINHPYWDVKYDGSEILHFCNLNEICFYKIELLTEEEIDILILKRDAKEKEKTKREEALKVLTEKLVVQMPSLHYLYTNDLEINHGIHLKEIKRGMYMNMPFKPKYGNVGWVANQVMNWGSCMGWDISLDGKIVCCRVHYDDYINFEVELLTDEEREGYKSKYQQTDKLLINRLATLTEMFERKLVSEKEFQEKKNEILQAI